MPHARPWIALLVPLTLLAGCTTQVHEIPATFQDPPAGALLPDGSPATSPSVRPETQLYSVVTDPEGAFQIIARDFNANTSVKVPSGSAQMVDINAVLASTVARLAENLDQINTQALGGYKAALFGLNSNPTSEHNQDQFWSTLRQINTNASRMRLNHDYYQTVQALGNGGLSVRGPEGSTTFLQFAPVGHRLSADQPDNAGAARSPWFDTQVDIAADEPVYIRASGDVSYAVHHLVDDAKTHRMAEFGWEGPDGLARFNPRGIDGVRLDHGLLPRVRKGAAGAAVDQEVRYGALIAKVVPVAERDSLSADLTDPEAVLIGAANFSGTSATDRHFRLGRDFQKHRAGRLYLSINEPMLGLPRAKDAGDKAKVAQTAKAFYAPNPFKEADVAAGTDVSKLTVDTGDAKKVKKGGAGNGDLYWAVEYYLLKDSNYPPKPGDKAHTDIWTQATEHGEVTDVKVKELLRDKYVAQLKEWDAIVASENWTAWFDDNVGSFLVVIERPSDSAPGLSKIVPTPAP